MFTILIVEDNKYWREMLHEILDERFRFPVLAEAKDVEEALAAIDSAHPDLIFLDINLPDGNGLELTRRLRAAGNDAAIAIYTLNDTPEYRDAARRSGANHFLVKGSASLGEIFGVVESAIESRFKDLIVAEDAVVQLLGRLSTHDNSNHTGGG